MDVRLKVTRRGGVRRWGKPLPNKGAITVGKTQSLLTESGEKRTRRGIGTHMSHKKGWPKSGNQKFHSTQRKKKKIDALLT